MSTKHRLIEAASAAFVARGVAGASLDEIARSAGVTKQTILYHFKSKSGLLEAVLIEAAETLRAELDHAVAQAPPGWGQVEAVVRSTFALAVRRPELLGLLGEVSRLGPPESELVLAVLQSTIDRAIVALQRGMDLGDYRQSDPRLVLLSSYSAVTGVVTDTAALRGVGLELDLRVAAQLRRSLLEFLQAALLEPTTSSVSRNRTVSAGS